MGSRLDAQAPSRVERSLGGHFTAIASGDSMDTIQGAVRTRLFQPATSLSNGVNLPALFDIIVHTLAQLTPGTHAGICATNLAGTVETLAGTDRLVFAL